jgi:hypothetical protein
LSRPWRIESNWRSVTVNYFLNLYSAAPRREGIVEVDRCRAREKTPSIESGAHSIQPGRQNNGWEKNIASWRRYHFFGLYVCLY